MQRNAEVTVRPAKRIKTGHYPSRTGIHKTGSQSSPHDGLHANYPRARREPLAARVIERVSTEISTDRVRHAPKTSVQRSVLSRYDRYEHNFEERTIKKKSYLTAEPLDIDLSVAPSDPVELALWIARWIETVSSHPTEFAPEATLTTAQRYCHPREPGIIPSEKADTDSSHRVLKTEIRVDDGKAQLWKQEWKRQGLVTRTHGVNTTDISVVRSSADIEQDSECYSNSIAGTISSEVPSEGSCSWPQQQFTEQKTKRHRDRRCMSTLESGFTISPHRSDSSQGGDHQVNLAKKFLLHTLRPIIGDEVEPSNPTTALAHKTAYANTDFNSRFLVLAIRALIEDSNIMAAVRMSLNHYGGSSSSDSDAGCASMRSNDRAQLDRTSSRSASASSPETDASLSSVQLKLRGGMIMGNTTSLQFDQSKSKKIIEAYNAANQIFEDTARSSSPTYITPYGDPQDNYVTPYGPPEAGSASITNGNGLNTLTEAKTPQKITTPRESKKSHCIADVINEEPVHKSDSQDDEIDHAQVDRLLLLAGGGSLTDDDDTDDEIEVLATFTKAELDEDIQMVLNQVYGTVAGRGSNGVKQAANLRSIMDQAGVIKNCIIPKDQSLATSKLYATLARCAQGSSRPGISLNPYHSNVLSSNIDAHAPGPFPMPVVPSHPGGFGESFLPSYGSNINGGPPHPFLGGFHGNFIPHVIGNQRGFLVPHYPGVYGHVMATGELAPTAPGPVVQQRPFVPSSEPPPPLPYRVGTARGKTAEEAKKVRDYGFPPLPSSRPGLRADTRLPSAKRKLDESIFE